MEKGTHEEERLVTFSTYGNSFSKGVAHTSAAFSLVLIFVSMMGLYEGYTIREVIDEIGVFLLFTTSIGLFVYQHKAIITRNTDSFTVRFWKQFTPLIVYSSRELDIKKLNLKQSRKWKTGGDGGSSYYEYTTKIYYNGSEIFSCKEQKSEFKEILPELFKNSEESVPVEDSASDFDMPDDFWKQWLSSTLSIKYLKQQVKILMLVILPCYFIISYFLNYLRG